MLGLILGGGPGPDGTDEFGVIVFWLVVAVVGALSLWRWYTRRKRD